MLELKIRMNNDGSWTVTSPDGTYRNATSLGTIDVVIEKAINDYAKNIATLAEKRPTQLEEEVVRNKPHA